MRKRHIVILKVLAWAFGLWTFLDLAWRTWRTYRGLGDFLGADPLSTLTLQTGIWTLNFVMITLLITPLRRVTGWNWLIKFRRLFGLFAFFYGSLHLLTYLWADRGWDLSTVPADIAKRPFITVGFAAWFLMVPLAFTSTAGWIRRMGGKNWARLHWLIYATGVLGVIHFLWLVKKDQSEPRRYALVLLVLLGFRIVWWLRERMKARKPAVATARA